MQLVEILHVISLLMWLNSGVAALQLILNTDLIRPIMCGEVHSRAGWKRVGVGAANSRCRLQRDSSLKDAATFPSNAQTQRGQTGSGRTSFLLRFCFFFFCAVPFEIGYSSSSSSFICLWTEHHWGSSLTTTAVEGHRGINHVRLVRGPTSPASL